MRLIESWFRERHFPTIHIELLKREHKQRSFYTTGDLIEGFALIETDVELRSQDLEISFCGDSQIVAEGIFLPVSTYRKKRFLQIQQPIDEIFLLSTHSDDAEFLYRIPFSFVVPDQLPAQTCQHMNDRHLLLPPSLGKDFSGQTQFPLDDMGCSSMSIVYTVHAKILNGYAGGDQPKGPWNSAFKHVQVIPKDNKLAQMSEHLMPALPAYSSHLMKFSQRNLGRGMLFARAWNARPIELRFPYQKKPDLSTSLIQMELEFQSAGHESPPLLRYISRKLIVHPIAHSMPFRPTPTGPACQSRPETNSRTVCLGDMDICSVRLLSRELEYDPSTVDGEKDLLNWSHDCIGSDAPRRHYTSIEIPIILPSDKTFVPSFESCMISRSYEVDVRIFFSSGWKGLSKSLSIRVPLQIVS